MPELGGVAAVLVAATAFAARASANQTGPGPVRADSAAIATRVEIEPRVDGRLDEPQWSAAPVAAGFVQREPRNGEPALERTEVRVVYTRRTLVIGARLFDSRAGGLAGTEYRRDADLDSDDNLQVFLDTFHDRRNAFFFQTNPLGTQRDGLIRNEGEDINWQWDGIWTVACTRTRTGGPWRWPSRFRRCGSTPRAANHGLQRREGGRAHAGGELPRSDQHRLRVLREVACLGLRHPRGHPRR